MKIIITALFLIYFSLPMFSQQKDSLSNETLKIIYSRKSVRHFTGKAIDMNILESLAKAGMAAPTAMNKQPWAFICIDRRSLLDSLNDKLPSAKMLEKAGGAIIVCGKPEDGYEGN